MPGVRADSDSVDCDRMAQRESIPADHFRLFKDGKRWCAVREGFIDLQKSPSGFGAAPEQAIDALLADEKKRNLNEARKRRTGGNEPSPR